MEKFGNDLLQKSETARCDDYPLSQVRVSDDPPSETLRRGVIRQNDADLRSALLRERSNACVRQQL